MHLLDKCTHIYNTLFEPVDGRGFLLYQRFLGGLLLFHALGYFYFDRIQDWFITPTFHYHYSLLPQLPVMAGPVMYGIVIGLVITSLGILLNRFACAASTVYLGLFSYLFFIDKLFYLDYHYLLLTLSLYLTLALWSMKDGARRWHYGVFQSLFVGIIVFGILAKFDMNWLRGDSLQVALTRFYPLSPLTWLPGVLHTNRFLIEIILLVMFLVKSTRHRALIAWILYWFTLMLFHGPANVLYYVTVISLALFWFPSDTLLTTMQHMASRLTHNAPSTIPNPSAKKRCLATFALLVFILLQVVIPFRHFFYPGDFQWTKEGALCSWTMKLNYADYVYTTMLIKDPDSKKKWTINPQSSNTVIPKRMFTRYLGDPYVMQLYVRTLQDYFAQQGYPNVQVYALTTASFNFGPVQTLYNPKVDLTTVSFNMFTRNHWVYPIDNMGFTYHRVRPE